MIKKRLSLLVFFGMVVVSSHSLAAESCGTLLVRCDQCHDRERICDNLGKSEKYWKSMIKYMISNGAEITDEESAIMTTCLSSKAEDAVNFCK